MAIAAGNLTALVPLPRLTGRGIDAKLPRRAVRRRNMVAVTAEVFRGGFPVGVEQPAVRTADFSAALAAIDKNIEIPGHVTQIFRQLGRVCIERCEDEALIAVDLRHRNQSPLFSIEPLECIDHRHERKLTIGAVTPAVVRTSKELRVAAISPTHPVASMPAEIQVRAQPSHQITTENHGLFSHVAHDKIAGIGNFAFMSEIEPTAREQTFTLELINLSIGENSPVDETAFRVDQRLDIHSRPLLGATLYTLIIDPTLCRQLAKLQAAAPASLLRPLLIRCKTPLSLGYIL